MKKYYVPKISLSTHITLLCLFVIIGSTSICLKVKDSIVMESIYTGLFVWCSMAIYYFIMIYNGVRYDNGYVKWKWENVSVKEMLEHIAINDINLNNISFPEIDFGDNIITGFMAFIMAILLGVIVAILVFFIMWLGFNGTGILLVFAWSPLYVLIKYGVRLSLINVVYSKGNIVRSIMLSLYHGCISGIAMACVSGMIEFVIRKI